MHIESGPKTERLVRNGLFFLMVAGFGAAFLYDGYKGYEKANFEEHLKAIDPQDRDAASRAVVYSRINSSREKEISQEITTITSKLSASAQRDAMIAAFGGPPSFESSDEIYYFGPDYRIKFTVRGGMLYEPVGKTTGHKMTDLISQRIIGWVLAAVGVVTSVFLIRIMLTHCRVDDTGMTYRFVGHVKWEDMKSLESTRFIKKGWVDLVWADGGAERRVRLDEYHLKRFPEIIAAICKKKGFDDPVAKEQAMKAAKAIE
ncbi:MAG: hypothetical protein KF841_07120 [Phycisphaerae bacterium]|nr:hypothetical protein [Phycisphaerae bacterium]